MTDGTGDDSIVQETLDFLASLQSPAHHQNEKLIPAGERTCPICVQKLSVEVAYGIAFDVCGDHGIWLDRGELESIIARIRSGERISRKQAIRDARNRGEREGRKIAGPLMSLFMMLFEE